MLESKHLHKGRDHHRKTMNATTNIIMKLRNLFSHEPPIES